MIGIFGNVRVKLFIKEIVCISFVSEYQIQWLAKFSAGGNKFNMLYFSNSRGRKADTASVSCNRILHQKAAYDAYIFIPLGWLVGPSFGLCPKVCGVNC